MSASLAAITTALETAAGASTGANTNEAGYWLRIVIAAESLAGAGTTANENQMGRMKRTAVALESIAGTSGAEENANESGYMKRIVDALEVQAGAVTTGSLMGRLMIAAGNAVFTPFDGGLVDNGDFSSNGTGWGFSGNGSSGSDNQWTVAAGAGFKRAFRQANDTLVAGNSYWYSFDLISRSAGLIGVAVGTSNTGTGGSTSATQSVPGTYTGVIDNITLTGQYIAGVTSAGAVLAVDNVIVRPALMPLTLSSSTVAEDASVGTAVGTLQKTTAGSTLALTVDAGGLFSLVGLEIRVAGALDYETATSHNLEVQETKVGVPNSPRTTVIPVTVTDVFDASVGPELVVGGDFASGTGWALDNAAITGGQLVLGPGLASATSDANDTLSDTNSYRVEFDVISNTGNVWVVLGGGMGTTLMNTTGHYGETVSGLIADNTIVVNGDADATVDNLTVKEVL